MKKICVVTGTRAEYGLLRPLLDKINKDNELELQLVVTGMHLSTEFGLTYKQIEEDGYIIDEKIEIVLSSDTPTSISKSMGLGMISFGETFERLKPDLLLVLGDRYEIFACACAAMMARISIAHVHGGELTEGAIDDVLRHCITKMGHLHFTTTEQYRRRVIQLGEQPQNVFNVGALGVENIKKLQLMTEEEISNEVGFNFNEKIALVTFHPVTLENNTSKEQFEVLLQVLSIFKDLKVIFTKANSDTDGRIINSLIDRYANQYPDKCRVYTSMGQKRYLSAMKYSSIVIGNSSSGIIEAPSFGIPVVNIGDRQKGRIHSNSVIDCKVDCISIEKAISKAMESNFKESAKKAINPYEKNNTSDEIIKQIKKFLFEQPKGIKKRFYDLEK